MKVLMVCLGNICRSPMAHGILQSEIEKRNLDWEVDSAGTSSWHAGNLPDERSIDTARSYGLDISNQRSRQIVNEDLEYYDLILAMDSENYRHIISMTKTSEQKEKIKILMNYSFPGENRKVPDPYIYGGFPKVFKMIEMGVLDMIEASI